MDIRTSSFPYLSGVNRMGLILILGMLLGSCMDDHGNKVQGGELTVYFKRDSDLEKAVTKPPQSSTEW